MRGIANHWFRYYQNIRQQFLSVTGFDSSWQPIKYGVLHDSLHEYLPSSLIGKLSFVNIVYATRSGMYYQLYRCKTKTILYCTNIIESKSVDAWNFINKL